MRDNSPGNASGYTAKEIRQYIYRLPKLETRPLMDERAAQAARSALGDTDPGWEQRLHAQIDAVTKELARQLDRSPDGKGYVVTANELRGIVARAIARATSQSAVDIGRALNETVAILGEPFGATPQADVPPVIAYEPDLQEGL